MPDNPFIATSIPYLTAFLAGLFGGVHCVGMCGGLMSAMVYGIAEDKRRHRSLWLFLFAYNFGRITTYTVLGIALGLLGAQAVGLVERYGGWMWMRILAGGLMVAMGLYLAGWWMGMTRLEQLGETLVWRKVQPVSKRLLRSVKTPLKAWVVGLFWGLLPCGLVYTMLIWSLAAGGWREGGTFLLSFGLGTLPSLLAVGGLTGTIRWQNWRHIAGLLVIGFGLWTILSSAIARINVGLGCLPVLV